VVNKKHTNNNNKKSKKARRNKKRYSLGAVFDKHIKCEFEDHDVAMTGGIGYDSVYDFYKNHFVGKMPDDTKVERISRTVGKNQVVDELILKFTWFHTKCT
jgi:carboxymethylenebutenolidase